MFLCFYVSLDLASVFFWLARSGRKTDGHIINIRMFIKLFFFFLHRQGLRVCPEAFFSSTKTQKHTFPARKKVPFPVLMCKVSGWLAHKKNTVSSRRKRVILTNIGR
jgi:hypothetical protein